MMNIADGRTASRIEIEDIMREFAKSFYKSKSWRNTRDAYINSVGYWCESCKAKGIYTRAEIVHHRVWITPENIDDPEVTLNFRNLKAVCRNCHAEEHEQRHKRRYEVDESGRVKIAPREPTRP